MDFAEDDRSKEQVERSLDRPAVPIPIARFWEPMGRSFEILSHSQVQTVQPQEPANRSKAATAQSHEGTNLLLPILFASDADHAAIETVKLDLEARGELVHDRKTRMISLTR